MTDRPFLKSEIEATEIKAPVSHIEFPFPKEETHGSQPVEN